VSTIEELLGSKSKGSGLEIEEIEIPALGIRHADNATSPKNGCRSAVIVRSRIRPRNLFVGLTAVTLKFTAFSGMFSP
jgi:hypothetical protein